LAGLATHNVDIYVEGLQADPDFTLSYGYADANGAEEAHADVHMAIADITLVDVNGNKLDSLSRNEELPEMLDPAAPYAKAGVFDSLPENEFKICVDGIHSEEINWLTLASDTGDKYYDSFTDTSEGAESNLSAVMLDDDDQALGSSVQAQFLSAFNVNALGAGSTVEIAFQTKKDEFDPPERVAKALESLYAIDGTTNTAASKTNIWQFYMGYPSSGAYVRHYYAGPPDVKDGVGSSEIVQMVENDIRADYTVAHGSLTIDLVGYSRGGVIAATVARDLNTGLVINGKLYQGISVQWVGLFDAVSRMGAGVNPPNGNGWALTFSGNIASHAHLIHTAKNDLLNGVVLSPVMTLGPTTDYSEPNGQPSDHTNLGHDFLALKWMIEKAQAAGVPVKFWRYS
jgi:hypothetical protein